MAKSPKNKPCQVSQEVWEYAAWRVRLLTEWIDEGRLGDPLDDVWFDLETQTAEIGFKPERGIFLGEVRDFHPKYDDLYGPFDDAAFQAVYDKLVEDEIFVKPKIRKKKKADKDVPWYLRKEPRAEHPVGDGMELILPYQWKIRDARLHAIFASIDLKKFKCLRENEYDPEYPLLFDEIEKFLIKSFDEIYPSFGSTMEDFCRNFEPTLLFKKALLRPDGPVDYLIKKCAEIPPASLSSYSAGLSRGLNAASVATNPEELDDDYPYVVFTMDFVDKLIERPRRKLDVDGCRAAICVAIWERLKNVRKAWRWNKYAC